MTREQEARAVLNRIVVAHNRLHRSEITPTEFDQFALGKLFAFADAEAAAMRERAFQIGDRVEKISGSSWRGKVVGTYSTVLTPEGYAVESDTEVGSVQIYPAKALRFVRALPATGEE